MWIINDNIFPLALCLFHYDLNCAATLGRQQVFNGHQALELTKSSFYWYTFCANVFSEKYWHYGWFMREWHETLRATRCSLRLRHKSVSNQNQSELKWIAVLVWFELFSRFCLMVRDEPWNSFWTLSLFIDIFSQNFLLSVVRWILKKFS